MTVGVDTDVLVNWLMNGAPDHLAAKDFRAFPFLEIVDPRG